MRTVEFRPEAESEIESAFWWYELQRSGLGDEFLANLHAAIESAVENPSAFRKVAPQTRRAVVRRFPYLLFYVVEVDRLVVTGLFHVHRSPGSWSDRLREVALRYRARELETSAT